MAYNNFKQDLISGKFADMVKEEARDHKVASSEEVYNIMRPLMAEHPDVEKMYGLFLTTRNTLISLEELFTGTVNTCSVYPREVIKRMLDTGATALILCHNHPSGDTKISEADIKITKTMYVALKSIGATLHDHLIIGNSSFDTLRSGSDVFSQAEDLCRQAGIQ